MLQERFEDSIRAWQRDRLRTSSNAHGVNAAIHADAAQRRFVAREREHRNVGAHARHPQRRRAGFGERDDGGDVEMVRHVHDRHRDGLVDVREHVFEPIVGRAAKRLVLFRADAQLGHRAHGAHRILADRRFGGQHDGVGAVHHGIRHVGNLGTRRRRRVDHRLEHLRGRDTNLVARTRETDQALLQARHRGIADFDGEIAARDHDHVARIDDRADIRHGLGALDLGHDVRVAAGRTQQPPRFFDIVGIARERHRHEIQLEVRSGLDVAPVLVRERRRRQPAALLVEPLVVGEPPALLHAAMDARALDALDLEHDEAVVEQQRVERDDVVREVAIRATHGMLVAGVRVHRHVEHELVAFDEHDRAGLERLDANLRALEVAHDADVAADLLGNLAHAGHARCLVGRGAVREIDAEHVGAREDQLLDDGGVVGGGAERGDDLGAAAHVVAKAFGNQRGVGGSG